MATKTVTRTEVEKKVVDGEFHFEEVEHEVELDVCDICGNDEVGIDEPFRYVSTLTVEELIGAQTPEEELDRLFSGVHVRVTLSNNVGNTEQVILERPLKAIQDTDATAASRLPEQATAYSVDVAVGPLRDRDEGEDTGEDADGHTRLLCPFCHDGFFEEGEMDG